MNSSWIGRRFGRYELRRQIGGGGSSSVFAAWDDQLEREIALKILHGTSGLMGDVMARFRQEAVLTARLNHPNIVPIYDVGEDQGSAYIAMRLLPGRTLGDLMAERGTLPQPTALDITRNLGEALAYAHQRGIVHRDLKPANVLFDEDGRPMLVDFGIAKALGEAKEGQGFTQDGTAIGTPAYMSPEQAGGKPIDYRSDIYSLGILLYEMVTGRTPFQGTSGEVMLAHISQPPIPPSRLRPQLNPEIEAIILKALAKEPAARFASMEEMLRAIRAVQRGESTQLLPSVPTASPPVSPSSAPTRVVQARPEAVVPPPAYAPAYRAPEPYVPAPSPYGGEGGGTTYPPDRDRGGRRGGFPFWSFLLLLLATLCSLGALLVGAAYGGYLPDYFPAGAPMAAGASPTLEAIGSPLPEDTPTVTPTGTLEPTQSPTPTETPTVTPTEQPTETPEPTPTETPEPSPTPACTIAPAPAFEGFWDRATMGCPTSEPSRVLGSYEPFAQGFMLYDSSRDAILVFGTDGRWSVHEDTWNDGDPEFACDQAEKLGRPARGFGKLWCEDEAVRNQIGDPLAGETTNDLTLQDIENGELMLNVPARPTRLALFSDGRYVAD